MRTPEPNRTVQAIVRKMADGIDHREIQRRMPWSNRWFLRKYLLGDQVRLSERTIDQVLDAIDAIRKGHA